jgi:hypothetical protein
MLLAGAAGADLRIADSKGKTALLSTPHGAWFAAELCLLELLYSRAEVVF